MPTIRQHIPAFFDGFEQHTADVETIEDLDRIKWIRSWRDDPGFYRFSFAPLNQRHPARGLLMAELKEGREWWVVGSMSEPLEGLPLWQKK